MLQLAEIFYMSVEDVVVACVRCVRIAPKTMRSFLTRYLLALLAATQSSAHPTSERARNAPNSGSRRSLPAACCSAAQTAVAEAAWSTWKFAGSASGQIGRGWAAGGAPRKMMGWIDARPRA